MSRSLVEPSIQYEWDAIDLQALPRLVAARGMSDRFGYLLRHYWTPASELEYSVTTEQKQPAGIRVREEGRVVRRMAACDADKCLWFETKTLTVDDDGLFRFCPSTEKECLCEYDRSKQTFRVKDPLAQAGWPVPEHDARNQAFLRQAVLTPLLPIPVGFSWHVDNEDGHLDFTLERSTLVDDMRVLLIRRKGNFLLHDFSLDHRKLRHRLYVEREGVTAFAVDRGIVLEDRTWDKTWWDGMDRHSVPVETLTRQTLVRSSWRQEDQTPLAPLFVKYRTDEHPHLYDCGTGKILEVDEAVYAIIDDYRILTAEQLRDKYADLGRDTVDRALADLEEARTRGWLHDHVPTELSPIDKVSCGTTLHDIGTYWQQAAMLLVLGVTERCNLDCEYCCYSGKFAGQRTHGLRSMPIEIAKKAIEQFLNGEQASDGTYPITFYGGEPLLEYDHLVRECVRFAEDLAGRLHKPVRFSITTNGTLLDDETVDFLVEHDFLVMISLDGPQKIHDRYRVFPDGSGSFEQTYRNLRRFAERYPNYRQRGLSMTLAPPYDLEATDALIMELFPSYPMTRASLVNTGTEHRFAGPITVVTRNGCHSAMECQKNSGFSVDEFRTLNEEDQRALHRLWTEGMKCIAEHGVIKATHMMPLAMLLFEQQIGFYHRRAVSSRPSDLAFYVPCVPGLNRRYCDVTGTYRVCERVDNSEAYCLGSVQDGLDTAELGRVMERRRHCGDCGNCVALKFCDACYARLPGENGLDPYFDLQCQHTRTMAASLLKEYTALMEANSNAFDRPGIEESPHYHKLRFGGLGFRLSPTVREKLQNES